MTESAGAGPSRVPEQEADPRATGVGTLDAELRLLDDALADCAERLRRMPESVAAAPAAGSRWTPRMHVEHAARAAELSLRAVGKILDRSPDCLPGDAPRGAGAAVLRAGRIPRGVAEAPGPTRPTEDTPAEAALAAIADARAGIGRVVARIRPSPDGLPAAEAHGTLPHFALGPFGPAEWTAFARIHLAHHAEIAGL